MITIRQLSEHDRHNYTDTIIALITELDPSKIPDKTSVSRVLTDASVVFGAFENNVLVGVAVGNIKPHFTGEDLYIDDVVVQKKFRGAGVGIQLLEAWEYFGVISQCSEVMLTSSRPDAQRFYENRGYQTTTRAFKRQLA